MENDQITKVICIREIKSGSGKLILSFAPDLVCVGGPKDNEELRDT
jgi:hypothetical protein